MMTHPLRAVVATWLAGALLVLIAVVCMVLLFAGMVWAGAR